MSTRPSSRDESFRLMAAVSAAVSCFIRSVAVMANPGTSPSAHIGGWHTCKVYLDHTCATLLGLLGVAHAASSRRAVLRFSTASGTREVLTGLYGATDPPGWGFQRTNLMRLVSSLLSCAATVKREDTRARKPDSFLSHTPNGICPISDRRRRRVIRRSPRESWRRARGDLGS